MSVSHGRGAEHSELPVAPSSNVGLSVMLSQKSGKHVMATGTKETVKDDR